MTMRTPEQWLDENDPAWQDVCGEQPVLTKEIISAIQSDARAELFWKAQEAQAAVENCLHLLRTGATREQMEHRLVTALENIRRRAETEKGTQ